MRWSEIRVLYLRELRSALRERSIVVTSLLLPVLLYPVMLWLMFTGMTFVQGLSEQATSRVAVFEALAMSGIAFLLAGLVAERPARASARANFAAEDAEGRSEENCVPLR